MVTCIKKIHFDHFTPHTIFGMYRNFMATNTMADYSDPFPGPIIQFTVSPTEGVLSHFYYSHSACIQLSKLLQKNGYGLNYTIHKSNLLCQVN